MAHGSWLMASTYIVPAKVLCLLDGVWQLLVQRLGQEHRTDSAQQKQGAQNVVRRAYIHRGAQVHQVRSQHPDRIRQNGAQCDARLSHARGVDLQALQIGREEGERVEKLDEGGQVDHQPLEALVRRIGDDGQAGEERDEEGHRIGKAPPVLVACRMEKPMPKSQ